MILKRQEKDNKVKAIYDSSNILASIYDKTTADLVLIFAKGRQYRYPKVKSSDYNRFEISESQGKVFNTHIKPYGSEKLDDINPDLIVKEIEELKLVEVKLEIGRKRKALVDSIDVLKSSVLNSVDDRALFDAQLETIKNNADIYLKQLNK